MKAYRDKRGNIWVEGKGGYTRLTEYDVSADHIDEGPIPPKRQLMYGLVELVEAPDPKPTASIDDIGDCYAVLVGRWYLASNGNQRDIDSNEPFAAFRKREYAIEFAEKHGYNVVP